MIRSETTRQSFLREVNWESSDADVPRTIPASCSVCGRVLPEEVVPEGDVWEEGREWEGQATRPTRGFSKQRQTRSGP